MACRGLCDLLEKTKRPENRLRYSEGQKRCKVCNRYWKTVALYCPCCGRKMQTRLKYLYQTERFRTVKRIEV